MGARRQKPTLYVTFWPADRKRGVMTLLNRRMNAHAGVGMGYALIHSVDIDAEVSGDLQP